MGIFASFLDLLWPSRKADPAPQPLPPIDFRALRGGAVYEDLPVSAYEPGKATRMPDDWKPKLADRLPVGEVAVALPEVGWKPWPPAQFDAEAERKLKKLASSRTREPVQVKPWSKPVRTPLGEFGSVTEAAEAHGIARSTLHEYLAKGVEGWERLPKPLVTVKGTRKAKRGVMHGRDAYVSVAAAARVMKRSTQTIHRWCKTGKYGFRYAD